MNCINRFFSVEDFTKRVERDLGVLVSLNIYRIVIYSFINILNDSSCASDRNAQINRYSPIHAELTVVGRQTCK